MVRFFMKGAALLLVIILTGTAIVAFPGAYLHELAAIINKRDMLVSRNPPRLIFIGGSNLLSLDGPMLERELEMPVVNMGLYANIPLVDYFDDIAGYLSHGDIVVIVQEYGPLINRSTERLTASERIGVEQFLFLLSPCKYILRSLERGAPFDTVRIWASLIQLKLKSLIKFAAAGKIGIALRPGVPRYGEVFDANGDYRYPFLVIRPLLEGAAYSRPDIRSITHLKRMIRTGGERGARVYFSFPPTPGSNFRRNRQQIEGLYVIMQREIPAALLNAPDDHCYPDDYFADTVNHLQPNGEKIRSRKLVEVLKKTIAAARRGVD